MDYAALIGMISKGVSHTASAGVGVAEYVEGPKAIRQRMADMAETERRTGAATDAIMGEAKANAAASGLATSSQSIQNYLGYMESEINRQADWTRSANAREISEALTARDWKLAGTVVGWMTGNGSDIGQMFGSSMGGEETPQRQSSLDVDYLSKETSDLTSDLESDGVNSDTSTPFDNNY